MATTLLSPSTRVTPLTMSPSRPPTTWKCGSTSTHQRRLISPTQITLSCTLLVNKNSKKIQKNTKKHQKKYQKKYKNMKIKNKIKINNGFYKEDDDLPPNSPNP